MNREVFCSCLMGSAVPLSYDLPSLPPFHSTFLFSFSISPLFILQQLSILLPYHSLLLALSRICFFSHLCRPPTHLFKKAFSQIPTHALWSWGTHTCTCSDCPLIIIISYQTRRNTLIQTIFFGRVTLALRTSLLNHRDHQSSSDNGKRFNIWDTQGKSELYGTWIRLRFPRNTFCPVCQRLSVYEEESVARSMYGGILSP